MKYSEIVRGRFVDRPNRFIAHVEIDGNVETVHVKNTGRCRELLKPGATVYLEKGQNPERKTPYDLVAVMKGDVLFNMDSQAPNKAVKEWLEESDFFADLCLLCPEKTFGNSRFDFYGETKQCKFFMEVKGVTLEEDGILRFPDAPSERAVKHLEELVKAVMQGYDAYVMFVVQMKGAKYFAPHWSMHPDFASALEKAAHAGVKVLAYDCQVTPESMTLDQPVEVRLREDGTYDMVRPLLAWYNQNRRILPWREEPTPYHVWLSEIMLQQTRVEAVKGYFERFRSKLPDIPSLANAQEDTLLKLWEGLGYYNRVRNLQKAAIQIMEEYGGEMPAEYDEILKLKGIGSYTAGAISSIAFGKPYPAVDGNVLRVLSRLRKDDRDIANGVVKTQIEAELKDVMPLDRPGDFNQAMMEIGATVCLPNGAPKCAECPLNHLCKSYIDGTMLDYPKKAPKKGRRIEDKTVLILLDEDKVALHKRPDKGLLAGLYEFPLLEGHLKKSSVLKYLKEIGLETIRITPLSESKHIFSHKEWHMIGYQVRVDELTKVEVSDWIFVGPKETQEKYPIPSAFSAYTDYLNIKQGKNNL
ncbi:MAG: A/G-specific adenine glycosylase [Lachnospiraceae bacterium]|nr:A/G-specific adenine glycosylase [Lachnospiraceae bacterium]